MATRPESLAELVRRRGPLSVDEAVDLVDRLARTLPDGGSEGELGALPLPGHTRIVDGEPVPAGDPVERGSDDVPRLDGTDLAHLAPEDLAGVARDARADVYALGACLTWLLAGRAPFTGRDREELLGSILSGSPELPGSDRDDIPLRLDRLVERCLAKNPDGRPRSPRVFREDLERARRGRTPERARRGRRFKGRLVVGIGLLHALVGLPILYLWAPWASSSPTDPPPAAGDERVPEAAGTDPLRLAREEARRALAAAGWDEVRLVGVDLAQLGPDGRLDPALGSIALRYRTPEGRHLVYAWPEDALTGAIPTGARPLDPRNLPTARSLADRLAETDLPDGPRVDLRLRGSTGGGLRIEAVPEGGEPIPLGHGEGSSPGPNR